MKRIIFSALTVLCTMLLLPLLLLRPADGWDVLGYIIIFFLILYPIQAILLGILAGTNWRLLWGIPVFSALLFPPLFWIAILDVVWELYIYAAIYLGLGALATITTALILHVVQLRKRKNEEKPEVL
ncbi:MAG: hypothetical protein E7624_05600 [Ruminococcaceae bacterium]|nr:hypothetical protein [Oscillospiraceae bacterium]